jgi:hypothetical protein
MLYQPLFGNMKITSQEGLLRGLEPKSKFCLWASKGIQHLEDLWNDNEDEERKVKIQLNGCGKGKGVCLLPNSSTTQKIKGIE